LDFNSYLRVSTARGITGPDYSNYWTSTAAYAPHYTTPTQAVLLALQAIAAPLLAALGRLRSEDGAAADKGALLLYALGPWCGQCP
jgi:hypothetical protein